MDYKDTFPYYRDAGGGFWSRNLWRYDGNMMGYGLMHEDMIVEDMEYLQQMYPTYARKYQSTINSFVDRMDYDGSFIYDQYPDKMSIGRMVTGVMAVIRANEEKENALIMPSPKGDSPKPPSEREGDRRSGGRSLR